MQCNARLLEIRTPNPAGANCYGFDRQGNNTEQKETRRTTQNIKRTNATQHEEAIEAEEKEQIESLRDYWLEPGGDRYDRHAQMDANKEGQQDMEQVEESSKKGSSSEDAARPRQGWGRRKEILNWWERDNQITTQEHARIKRREDERSKITAGLRKEHQELLGTTAGSSSDKAFLDDLLF